MQIYRSETTISKDGSLSIKDLPFRSGDKVEVIVRQQYRKQKLNGRYPLRGKPITYIEPFESAVEDHWQALK